jgi:hypothetical protein
VLTRELLRYWPNQEEVAACIKTDAEASSEAVSLAVHQPMGFERRTIGAGDTGVLDMCDEHALLKAFLTETLSEGRVIVPIVGSSGIGKSHVLRWLDAQIRRLPGANNRVVIRIPKGTSLKGVLDILLDAVRGPEYERYRQELTRAQEQLEPKEAAGLLCEMLAYSITEMGVEAQAKLVTNPSDRDAREREAYCRADMLPALLRNQLLRDQHFVSGPKEGVIDRLVEQLTQGRTAGEDRKHLFTADDLMFGERVERKALGNAEARAIAKLDREDRRSAAVRILNAALDDAKHRLVRLDPTVSDLFDAVRKELLKDKKELILLVEDFADLSGLQKQLLQVIIKEAFRDGRQVLCTMRTALAYTTGYMDTATVLTRANIEYRIPDEPGTEDEILSRIESLVSAYLNAARLGQSAIEDAYRHRSYHSDDLQDWIPTFSASVEPEARATLDAFGKSKIGYELFPLNAAAIHELARGGCVGPDGRTVVYNPRFVIQNVINKILAHREVFEHGDFPPPNLATQHRPPTARVVEEVRKRVPQREVDRYLRFLTYWGGFPSVPAEISRVETRVFAAFGFQKPVITEESVRPTTEPVPSDRKPTSPGVTPPPTGREISAVEAQWENIFERWRGGVAISQSDANRLRKWIAEGLKNFANWDWNLFRPRKDAQLDSWSSWIYVPQAGGNEGRTAQDAMVAVCSDADVADPLLSASVQSKLMSVVRFHAVNNCTWDYPGADEDLPRYTAFFESLVYPARDFVRKRYFKAEWDPVSMLVQGLLIGARALGIETTARDSDHAALINALFVPNPDNTTPQESVNTATDATNWTEFTQVLQKCRPGSGKESRDQPSWRGHLLNLIGARQGQADAVHAIDIARIKTAIEETVRHWDFSGTLPNPSGVPDFVAVRTTYSELKRLSSAISKTQQSLFDWQYQFRGWIGGEVDKEVVILELKNTVELSKAAGLTPGIDTKRLLQLLESFRNAKVKAALDDAARLSEDATRGAVLGVLGRGYQPVVRICQDLQESFEQFLVAIEAQLASESLTYGEDPLKEATASLHGELAEIETLLKGSKDDSAGSVSKSANAD